MSGSDTSFVLCLFLTHQEGTLEIGGQLLLPKLPSSIFYLPFLPTIFLSLFVYDL